MTIQSNDLQTTLSPYFIEMDSCYKKLQQDRGDKILTDIKKKFDISYSQLAAMYKLHKEKK